MFTSEQANDANYATVAISLAVLLTRLIVGRMRNRPLDLSFYLVILSIIFVIARITLNYFQLRLGTSNDALSNPSYYNKHSPSDVVSGSKVILAGRVALTCVLWLQVCLLLLFYGPILNGTRWVRHMIQLTWIVAALTFIIVILITFLECRPLSKLWQTTPHPSSCAKAYAQLLSQCICNIVLDVMLLIISFPILLHRGRHWSTNIRIGSLFILGTFCMVVTIMRLTAVFGDNGYQSARTVWGAVQVIVATFVANAPIIYGDSRVVYRRKKEAETRRTTRSESWTGNSMMNMDVERVSDTDGERDEERSGEKSPRVSPKGEKGDLEESREVSGTSTGPQVEREGHGNNGTALDSDGISPRTSIR